MIITAGDSRRAVVLVSYVLARNTEGMQVILDEARDEDRLDSLAACLATTVSMLTIVAQGTREHAAQSFRQASQFAVLLEAAASRGARG